MCSIINLPLSGSGVSPLGPFCYGFVPDDWVATVTKPPNASLDNGTNSSGQWGDFSKGSAPNIAGELHDIYGGVSVLGNGSFSTSGSQITFEGAGNNHMSYNVISFYASQSNAIYAANAGLQVPACLCLVAIRF